MEEKELEKKETEQPKKKGGKTSAKKKETVTEQAPEEQLTEQAPEETPTVTETPATEEPLNETPVDTTPTVTETSAPAAPVEVPTSPAPAEPEKKQVNENKGRKPVPSIAELRKMRRYNEGVFTFPDGFACVASSQRVADTIHKAWLAGE